MPITAADFMTLANEKLKPKVQGHLNNERQTEYYMNEVAQYIDQNRHLLQVDRVETLLQAFLDPVKLGFSPMDGNGYIKLNSVNIGGKQRKYIKAARYELMIGGVRAKAHDHGISIRANVVHQDDVFEYDDGDMPSIVHKVKARSRKPDEHYCAYAIFSDGEGNIIHREVMFSDEIAEAEKISRDGGGGHNWGTWWPEMWRKTVVRRGAKSVNLDDELSKIITRDDNPNAFAQDKTPPAEETEFDDKQVDLEDLTNDTSTNTSPDENAKQPEVDKQETQTAAEPKPKPNGSAKPEKKSEPSAPPKAEKPAEPRRATPPPPPKRQKVSAPDRTKDASDSGEKITKEHIESRIMACIDRDAVDSVLDEYAQWLGDNPDQAEAVKILAQMQGDLLE